MLSAQPSLPMGGATCGHLHGPPLSNTVAADMRGVVAGAGGHAGRSYCANLGAYASVHRAGSVLAARAGSGAPGRIQVAAGWLSGRRDGGRLSIPDVHGGIWSSHGAKPASGGRRLRSSSGTARSRRCRPGPWSRTRRYAQSGSVRPPSGGTRPAPWPRRPGSIPGRGPVGVGEGGIACPRVQSLLGLGVSGHERGQRCVVLLHDLFRIGREHNVAGADAYSFDPARARRPRS
jgi:hypothetical protein